MLANRTLMAASSGANSLVFVGQSGTTTLPTGTAVGDYVIHCVYEDDTAPVVGDVTMTLISSRSSNGREVGIWGGAMTSAAISDGTLTYRGRTYTFRPSPGASVSENDGGTSTNNVSTNVVIDMTAYSDDAFAVIGAGAMDDQSVGGTGSFKTISQVPAFDDDHTITGGGPDDDGGAGYAVYSVGESPSSVTITATTQGSFDTSPILCTAVIGFSW